MKLIRFILGFILAASLALGADSVVSDRSTRAKEHRELRLEYAKSKEYNPYSTEVTEIGNKAQELFNNKDFDAAIKEADKGLKIDKYNIQLLITQAAAYREKGDIKKADETRQLWMSLIDSILMEKKGQSYEDAFQVISVKEEYTVLRVMGLTTINQSLEMHEGSSYDVITAQSKKSGQMLKVFFNIDVPQKWLNQSLSKTQE